MRIVLRRASMLVVCAVLSACASSELGEAAASEQSQIHSDLSGAFGRTSPGTEWASLSADYNRVSSFSLPAPNVRVSKLTAHLNGRASKTGTQPVRGLIYASDGGNGAPGTLRCVSAELKVPAGMAAAWKDLHFVSPCSLASAGTYYLGLHSGGPTVARYSRAARTDGMKHVGDLYADGAASPFGSAHSTNSEIAIFATFDAAEETQTFGGTTPGSAWVTASSDYKRVTAFALSETDAAVTKLAAYLDGLGATTGSQTVRGIIYASDGANGDPGTLLCSTAASTVNANAAASWVELPISGSCNLVGAGTYYLGVQTGPTAGVVRYNGVSVIGALKHAADVFVDGPSPTFGSAGLADIELALYATYRAATGSPPSSTSPPTVSGAAQVGQTLSGSTGAWAGTTPMSYAYQWLRCDSSANNCLPLSGKTAQTYTVTSEDVGSTLRLRVTATNAVGSGSAQSAPSAVITSATGATYYVSTTGSDFNLGTSEASAFRTVTHAYSRVVAGDTVLVLPGRYTDFTSGWGLRLFKSGTAQAPITLKSATRWGAILDGGNTASRPHVIAFEGSYNVVEGFEMTNGFLGGITIWGNSNRIQHNHIHHNGNGGDPASSYGQDGVYSASTTSGNQYLGNYIHHNGRISLKSNLDHGLYLCGDNEVVANNLVTDNCTYGLHLAGYDTQRNMKVYNNVFAWNGRSGAILWMQFLGVEIKNNIFYRNAESGISTWDAHGSGVVIDHNLFYGNPSGATQMTSGGSDISYTLGASLTTDPLFVSATNDFHLRNGSPAIDTGVTVTDVPVDFDGVPRPRGAGYDLGAFEYTP